MKKICLLLIPVLFLLTSCSVQKLQYYLEDDKSRAEKITEKIVQSISDKDSASLEALFSKKARTEDHDFNENVTELFEFIQGDIVSSLIEPGVGNSKSVHYGKVSHTVIFTFVIETNNQKYSIWLEDCIRDDIDKDNLGITYLHIINGTEWPKKYSPGSKSLFGINIENVEANNR